MPWPKALLCNHATYTTEFIFGAIFSGRMHQSGAVMDAEPASIYAAR